jgi:hypothetical protein
MIVYNTQNYWVFGLCPLSGILETENNVSETGSFSILRSPPSLEDRNKSSLQNIVFSSV